MDVIELLGRILLATVFLVSPAGVVTQAPKVAGIPSLRAFPRPFAVFAIRTTCTMALVGGVLIALGLWPDVGALLVVGFLVPVTLTMHRFWEMEPSLARKQRQDAFFNNTALAGAALLLFALVNQAQDVGLGVLSDPLFGRI